MPAPAAIRYFALWMHSRSPNSQRFCAVPPHGPLASPLGHVSGHTYCVAARRPGDLFGAGGISGSLEQSVYGQAVDRCVVFTMSRAAFEEVLEEHPGIALNVIKLVGARLRLACDAMTDNVTQRVEARLARVLLRLASNWGEISPRACAFACASATRSSPT